MGFGSFGLGAVASLIGMNLYNSPAAIFDGIIDMSTIMSGPAGKGGGGRSGITSATVGMVSAYTNSDFNAYTSYANRCYGEVDEPITELSALAPEVRSVTSVLKILDRGTPEQKKKVQDENQLLKGLQEARLVLLNCYYPGVSPEQIDGVGRFYFEPVPVKESAPVTAAPAAVKVSASAADGFTETEFGKGLGSEAEKLACTPGGFEMMPVVKALAAKGVAFEGKKNSELADFLAKSDRFVECTDSRSEQLKELPPGAVVVWGEDDSHTLGCCSVALGGGKEASNIVRSQRCELSSSYRLFLPC